MYLIYVFKIYAFLKMSCILNECSDSYGNDGHGLKEKMAMETYFTTKQFAQLT